MAIAETARRTDPIVATGGERLLPYPFRVLAARDVAVQLQRNGNLYRLYLGYDYTVEGVGELDGGNVRLARPAVAGDTYVIEGQRPQERATDIEQQKILDARFLNNELDSLQIQLQELRRDITGIVSRLPPDLLLPPINIPALDPHQEWLLKLLTAGGQLLGSAKQVGDEATDWAQATAEASLRNLLDDIEEGANHRIERVLQVEHNTAVAAQIETLTAAQGDGAAGVQQQLAAIANDVAAVAQSATTTAARVDEAEASVTSLQGAVVGTQATLTDLLGEVDGMGLNLSGVQALVDQMGVDLSGLQVDVGGVQNEVQQVRAYVGIVLQAGNRIGFFRMDGTPGEFNAIFGTDKFIIVPPGGTSGVTPFVVGFVNGVSTTVLGNLIADDAIIARHISVANLAAVSASFGDAQFTGKAKGATSKLVIDFDAETITGTALFIDAKTGDLQIG